MANQLSEETYRIRSINSRLKKLARHMGRFNFPLVARPLAGLLTQPENHTATKRLEALIHLAALSCRGSHAPTNYHLRRWLKIIFKDSITKIEDPVEDIFASNVGTGFGNVRLFEGVYGDNAYYVETCLSALATLEERTWVKNSQRHITALLRISEVVAERARILRNTPTESAPQEPVTFTASAIKILIARTSLSKADLAEMNLSYEEIEPFVFQKKHRDMLVEETLGHTSLERHPLVHHEDQIIVALPTAIGAAIRRFAIEQALKADDLDIFRTEIDRRQFSDVFVSGCPFWGIRRTEEFPNRSEGVMDFVGMFDDSSCAHIVLATDDLEETVQQGLSDIHWLGDGISKRITEKAMALADQPDYRRGLTLIIHGGIGRGFGISLNELPPNWHLLTLRVSDFMLLGVDFGDTALRAWKLLQQERELQEKEILYINLGGFINLYASRRHQNFDILHKAEGTTAVLHTDSVLELRHGLRLALDQHVVIAPDGASWIKVHREPLDDFSGELYRRSVFFSSYYVGITEEFLACVETSKRPWWVRCVEIPSEGINRNLEIMVWEMAIDWLERLAPLLEEHLATLPTAPITYRLCFPDILDFSGEFVLSEQSLLSLPVVVHEREVEINCSLRYIFSFSDMQNVGDRMMISALVKGAYMYFGIPVLDERTVEEIVRDVANSDHARFLHMNQGKSPRDIIYNAIPLPEPRFILPEDVAWSSFDLARRAGWASESDVIALAQTGEILRQAVDAIWSRIRERLLILDRRSVLEQSLLNFEALQKDRREWRISSAALFALNGSREKMMDTLCRRDSLRDAAGLASRVIAEMALCTSPIQGGAVCAGADIDFLIAELGMLLTCAYQSDAVHYGLVSDPLTINANGSFNFNFSNSEMQSYMEAYGTHSIQEAVDGYGLPFSGDGENGEIDIAFEPVFLAEFGLTIEQYLEFTNRLTKEVVEAQVAYFWLSMDEIKRRLKEAGVSHPVDVIKAFSLVPRAKWDESNPKNANRRDWYPWRYNRRLSIMRRPLIQLAPSERGPDVLVMPTLLTRTLDYLLQAMSGRLPVSLFDSGEMVSWVGGAADRNGHEFAHRVAAKLKECGWKVRTQLQLTFLGGQAEHGDIDVLAWKPSTGLVYAIECKSLSTDRTVGEIGERLAEYMPISEDGTRTPTQKHVDRFSYLKSNENSLAALCQISTERLELRSALVTEKLMPMQFSEIILQTLDLVIDFDQLDEDFK